MAMKRPLMGRMRSAAAPGQRMAGRKAALLNRNPIAKIGLNAGVPRAGRSAARRPGGGKAFGSAMKRISNY